jgi:hypothetical protein
MPPPGVLNTSPTGIARLKAMLRVKFAKIDRFWWARLDLNQEPTNYEFAALTN